MKEIFLKIDDEEPFILSSDNAIEIGVQYGHYENPSGAIRTYKLDGSSVTLLHYKKDGLEVKSYFRKGEWKAAIDNKPLFHAQERLV